MNKETNKKNVKLILKGLSKRYPNGDGVNEINIDVYEGELLTMLGPSGCGKTTILRAIGGFVEPDSGEIILDGENIVDMPPEQRPTAMVFQGYNLWPHMSIYDNLAFGLKIRKVDKNQIKKEVSEVLNLVKMDGIEKKYPSQLSGGQQQRVAIARALLLKPSVLLMDEPFSALDAKIRSEMREELKKIQSKLSITVLFVTHDQEEAMSISDRIIVMNKGKIEQTGIPEDIYDNPASKFTAEFIGEMNFIKKDKEIIAARPENVILSKENETGFTGSIDNIMILGHFTEISVNTESGNIKAFLQREKAQEFKAGDKVSVNFKSYKTFNL